MTVLQITLLIGLLGAVCMFLGGWSNLVFVMYYITAVENKNGSYMQEIIEKTILIPITL
ncbi:hypothetical protein [Treponema pedis]|uniref:hypothetical protein n=1 Tax=Treponema pedis TaxID=409322 RepID=UPI003D1A56D0